MKATILQGQTRHLFWMGSYLENDDWQEIHWCIDTEPDVYAMEEVSGTLRQLTEQTVTGEIQSDGNIRIYVG